MTGRMEIVTIAVDDLRALVRDEIDRALEAHTPPDIAPAPLVSIDGLAEALACSRPTINRLRRQPGFPELRLVDAPRFRINDVIRWLRAREGGDDAQD